MTFDVDLRAPRPDLPGNPDVDLSADLQFAGVALSLRPSGALWWAAKRLLAVADLHLGRSERSARRGGSLLPPYETADTVTRLTAEIAATDPAHILCLGDSFDDGDVPRGLAPQTRAELRDAMGARRWTWVAGNHDPRPTDLPGDWAEALTLGPLTFRHIADGPTPAPGQGEVSGHYHPKARLIHRGRRLCRPCFLADRARLVLPAFGTYTGGLLVSDPVFDGLLDPTARAYLTGKRVVSLPKHVLV
ncbi:MAG: ligase-associated DNA damage response endonuclease PdeM [Pikeienuella sp.]